MVTIDFGKLEFHHNTSFKQKTNAGELYANECQLKDWMNRSGWAETK